MLNLIPKRCAEVSLLHGKRALQRIRVGRGSHHLELPQSSVDCLYDKINKTVAYHNNDYHPLQWKEFFNIKLSSYYLVEAAESAAETKTGLSDLNWFGELADIYQTNAALAAADAAAAAAEATETSPITFPIRK